MEIRVGQKWRRVPSEGEVQILTVDSVEGNSVLGSQRTEDDPTTSEPGAWKVADFEQMTLVSDPQWQAHRVVCCLIIPGSEHVRDALKYVGQFEEASDLGRAADGSPTPVMIFSVVAPTAQEAVGRVNEATHHVSDGITETYVQKGQ